MEDRDEEESFVLKNPVCECCGRCKATKKCYSCNRSICINCLFCTAINFKWNKQKGDVEILKRCTVCDRNNTLPRVKEQYVNECSLQ
jgi:hypothetical protein